MKLENILEEKFGFSSFRTGQKEIINDIIKGRDVLAVLPTGGGKSICYLLPGYIFEKPVVIVSPLLSLMEDQVQQLKLMGEKRVIALNSYLSFKEKKHALRTLHTYRYIYVSPEILQSEDVQFALQKMNVRLFVIDEAHCISQWGHEFRTDYLKLKLIKDHLGNPACLALTATASLEVQNDIITQLNLKNVKRHIYSIDRKNIAMMIRKMKSIDDKVEKVKEYVKTLKGPGIIYFSSREWTERMVDFLRLSGINNVACYHGGLPTEERIAIQQQFINDELEVICATNAFGMGINKANIRYVIHFHYPKNIEAYIQEIGRAGRDGKDSIAILLYGEFDHEIPETLIHKDLPDLKELKQVLYELINEFSKQRLTKEKEIEIIEKLNIDEVKWRFLKYHLETLNVIQNGEIDSCFNYDVVVDYIKSAIEKRTAHKKKES